MRLHPLQRRDIANRIIGAICGAAGAIGMVLALGYVGEQDYQDALRAQQQAREARADAIVMRQEALRQQRQAAHMRNVAEASMRLQDMQKGEWR